MTLPALLLALLIAFGPRYAIATAIAVLLHQEFIHGEPGGMPLLAASAIFSATDCWVARSCAKNTSPIPPLPRLCRIS